MTMVQKDLKCPACHKTWINVYLDGLIERAFCGDCGREGRSEVFDRFHPAYGMADSEVDAMVNLVAGLDCLTPQEVIDSALFYEPDWTRKLEMSASRMGRLIQLEGPSVILVHEALMLEERLAHWLAEQDPGLVAEIRADRKPQK